MLIYHHPVIQGISRQSVISNFALTEGRRSVRLSFIHDLLSIHIAIYDSLTNFQKNNTQHPLKPYKYKKSKSSSINKDCNFLLDLDPHWCFGKVVPLNHKIIPMGVTKAP